MCKGTADAETPPPQRIHLERPTTATPVRPRTSTRPSSSSQRPRPKSSAIGHERPPSTRHRPESSRRPSSSRREPKTPGGGKRSHRERSHISTISEYPEDKSITRRMDSLATLIDEHAKYYYPEGIRTQGHSALDNLNTRYPAIRRYIAKEIIESIIEQSSSDISLTANEISSQLEIYADPNTNDAREAHIQELCKLGEKLRVDIEAHPATWTFGSWNEGTGGFIVMIPALLRDGEQVVAQHIFRGG